MAYVRVDVGNDMMPGAGGGAQTGGLVSIVGISTRDLSGLDAHRFGVEMASRLTHEGQHGIDERQSGMPVTRSEEKTIELRAFTSQSFINEAFRTDSIYKVWTTANGFDRGMVEYFAEQATQLWCGGTCH